MIIRKDDVNDDDDDKKFFDDDNEIDFLSLSTFKHLFFFYFYSLQMQFYLLSVKATNISKERGEVWEFSCAGVTIRDVEFVLV